jgi:polyphosphate kinase
MSLSQALADVPLPELEVKDRYLNRDLSWLEFDFRVLREAMDDKNPLLERVRFMSIFTSNLDEFFMKRVGWLRRQARAHATTAVSPDGRTPQLVLKAVRERVVEQLAMQADDFSRRLRPALRDAGVHLCPWEELTEPEQVIAKNYFEANVFPVLTPLAVDTGSPFPFISNLSVSLGIRLWHPEMNEPVFARVKVPEVLPKWVRLSPLGEMPIRMVALHDLIRVHLTELFPELTIEKVTAFRVTRNAEIARDEEEDADDLREVMQEELRQRRFAEVVRLETAANPDPWMLSYLKEELHVADEDCYEMSAELDYEDLKVVADLPVPTLKFEPWTPVTPKGLEGEEADIFALVRRGDFLVHHPYESFEATVGRFVEAATEDPKVLAIKMTLYRVGDSTGFIKSLITAAERGKQVVVLVELKARFDEERNLRLADALERAGAHVVYGVVGLKTHTKVTLVVREEPDGSGGGGIRSYAHIGSGNYNATTSRLYTDVGLFTTDADITRDVVELFHYLTGRSMKRTYRRLLVAPANMRDRVLELIEREADHARAGRPARIIAKMNQLEDRKVCNALYVASQAGVQIDLIVRGFCTLRPGVPGLSENIRVTSVIGRFLEHSRIFYYRNGQHDEVDGDFFIGSADWMYRNLQARVEAVVPVLSRALKPRLMQILNIALADRRSSWDMNPDGRYAQRTPAPGEERTGTQQVLMQLARQM